MLLGYIIRVHTAAKISLPGKWTTAKHPCAFYRINVLRTFTNAKEGRVAALVNSVTGA